MAGRKHLSAAAGLGLLAVLCATPADAQDLDARLQDPRSIGRAGATTVSGDSGAALVVNPGGMVRRSQPRLLLSSAISDQDASFEGGNSDSPVIDNRASPQSAPLLAYHRGNEEGTWVLGALLMRGGQSASLPSPAFGQPADDVAQLFPHRYGGTSFESIWTKSALGGAMRIGESVGLGASVSVSQFELLERRRIWAGFAGRDPLLGAERDLELVLGGSALFVPGLSIGALIAPPQIPLEFGIAAEYQRGARIRGGRAELNRTNAESFPQPTGQGRSRLTRPDQLVARAGVRYLGERSFVELGLDYQAQLEGAVQTWSVQDLQVVDESTAMASLDTATALLQTRSHLALRGALDYEAVQGFLWLTAGYAWVSPSSPRNLRSPSYARLGGHTLSAGLEAAYEGYILSLGYARSLPRRRSVSAEVSQSVANPFESGTGPANAGRYTASADQLGFAVELSWE